MDICDACRSCDFNSKLLLEKFYTNGRLHLFSVHRGERTLENPRGGGDKEAKIQGGAIESQKFKGEGVIKRQKSKGGSIKSLKFLGNS